MAARSLPATSIRSQTEARSKALDPVAQFGLLATVLCGVLACVSATHTNSLLPETVRPLPAPLAGAFAWGPNLHTGGIFVVLGLFFVAYACVVTRADRLSAPLLFGAIAALYTVVLLGPPLFSTDIFSYEAYGRIGALYHASPYLHGPHAIALDPIVPYVGAKWAYMPSAYGPIFTGLSYVLAPLSIAAGVLAYKAIAVIGALALVTFVHRTAALRDLDPVRAAAIVGLNPLLVLYGLGGGHNDLLMLAGMAAAIYALELGRTRTGGGLAISAIAVKLTGAILLPFALADGGRRRGLRARRDLLVGGVVVLGALAVGSEALFGTSILHVFANVRRSQSESDWASIPGAISLKLGLPTVGSVVGDVLTVGCVVTICLLLRGVWRGALDWLDAAGWATVALLVSAGSVLPWYATWLLPFAALTRDSRLLRTALILTGLIQAIQLLGYIPHGTPLLM